jgi:hypothetical protein
MVTFPMFSARHNPCALKTTQSMQPAEHNCQNRTNRSPQPFGSAIVPSRRIPSCAQTKFAPQNSIDEKEEKL